jgi:hypothetical protein
VLAGQRQHRQRRDLCGNGDGQQLGDSARPRQTMKQARQPALDRRREQRQPQRSQHRELEAGVEDHQRLDGGERKRGQSQRGEDVVCPSQCRRDG